jgi:WD40 repeat protein
MAEVFISYARTDQGFARDLNAALEKSQRETWMDWRSIPDSAQWRTEIFAAIEAADNFLFLVSPDSLRSPMCKQEVAHAVANGKRIVTILYHQARRKDLFPGLGEIQWINYPELGFKRTFQKVKAAIDADLEWGKKHTQIGLRAAQWEVNHRENGYLLHGPELQDAIRWLQEARKIKVRQPTELHEKFIRTSEAWEKGEIRRLTRLTEEKERQRIKAERAVRMARARELVASSVQSLEEDPERSVLLAMHALQATWRRDRIAIPEAEAALHQALELSFARVAAHDESRHFTCIAWSPDGTRVATGSHEKAAEVWDARSGKRLIAFGHRQRVTAVSWSPDGKMLATASSDRTTKVWNVENGRLLYRLRHQSGVSCVAWSPDGRRIATGSKDARCWTAKTGRLVRCFRGHRQVDTVAWKPDSKCLATTGAQDDTVKIWDATTGKLLTTYINNTHGVNSVVWSPDGDKLLMSGGWTLGFAPTNVARVWDATKKRGGALYTLPAQGSELTDASWSPDGDQLATATYYGRVKIWNAHNGAEVLTLRGHTDTVEEVVWSPASNRVATASLDSSWRIWHVNIDSELPLLWGHQNKITAVAWSCDSMRMATGSWDGTARIWDANTGQQEVVLGGEEGVIRAITWSPDGTLLATAAWDDNDENTAKVWKIESGKVVVKLKGHSQPLTNIVWSPDGSGVVTTSWDRTARIWNPKTGQELHRLAGHSDYVHAASWSPDSRFVATGSLDGTAKIWNAFTGKKLFTLPKRERGIAVAVWSPDGTKLATGGLDHKARVWDTERRRELRVFAGHRDRVTTLAWSPDGRRLAVSGGNEMGGPGLQELETRVTVWNVSTGEQEMVFSDHKDVVNSVAWSPDGKRLATASVDRSVRQYAMDVALLLQTARTRLTRNLTREECWKYLHRKDVPPIP